MNWLQLNPKASTLRNVCTLLISHHRVNWFLHVVVVLRIRRWLAVLYLNGAPWGGFAGPVWRHRVWNSEGTGSAWLWQLLCSMALISGSSELLALMSSKFATALWVLLRHCGLSRAASSSSFGFVWVYITEGWFWGCPCTDSSGGLSVFCHVIKYIYTHHFLSCLHSAWIENCLTSQLFGYASDF